MALNGYQIALNVFFGVLPSLVWLFYYLQKDMHPEPKRMILKIFLWGALITIPTLIVQLGLASLLKAVDLNPILNAIIYWFLVIALTEELFKFLVVRMKIFNSEHFDEPLDIMLYMVVAALGFAALENVLYLFAPVDQMSFDALMGRTLAVSFVRFIGATFLHTLCSAVVGYSLAISFCDRKNQFIEATAGISMAVLLHGIYDFSIMSLTGYSAFAVPLAVILTLAFLVFWGFDKLKKLKSVTILN